MGKTCKLEVEPKIWEREIRIERRSMAHPISPADCSSNIGNEKRKKKDNCHTRAAEMEQAQRVSAVDLSSSR